MIKNEVLAIVKSFSNKTIQYDVTRSSIQVPYFGEEIYLRKVALLHMNMPKICVLQVPPYFLFFYFKAVRNCCPEWAVVYKSILSYFISRYHCLYKTVGKATEILVKYIS